MSRETVAAARGTFSSQLMREERERTIFTGWVPTPNTASSATKHDVDKQNEKVFLKLLFNHKLD